MDGSVAAGMPGKFRGRSRESQEGEDEQRYHGDSVRCRFLKGGGLVYGFFSLKPGTTINALCLIVFDGDYMDT